ncbi:MAG: hypothetical protein WC944_09845 [Candidatus Cloacimonadaceae bacterium]|jgi:hypothetical protein|nr:hypothetical protein [Candidatus Cloacimonadota bacterium]
MEKDCLELKPATPSQHCSPSFKPASASNSLTLIPGGESWLSVKLKSGFEVLEGVALM